MEIVKDLLGPYLTTLSEAKWNEFREEFEAYRAKGGKKSMRQLTSTSCLKFLRIENPEADFGSMNDEEFAEVINNLFSIADSVEVIERIKRFKMSFPKDFSNSLLVDYIMKVQNVTGSIADEMLPKDRLLVQNFINGLQPKRLKELVEAESPDSLEESFSISLRCHKTLVSRAKGLGFVDFEFLRQMSSISAAAPAKVTGKPENKIPAEKVKDLSKITCFKCREKGHYANQCPLKKKESKSLKMLDDNMCDDDIPILDVVVHVENDVVLHAMCDTGSTISTVSKNALEILKRQGCTVECCHREVTVGGGHKVPVRDMLKVEVSLAEGTERVPTELFVMESGHDLILSYPLLKKLGLFLQPLPENGKVEFFSENQQFFAEIAEEINQDIIPTPIPDPLEKELTFSVEESPIKHGIMDLCKEYEDIFDETLPAEGADIEPFQIELVDDSRIPAEPPRPLPPAIRQSVKDEVEALLKKGFIRQSSSPFAAPIVMVKQKGKFRMCIDFRKLNAITKTRIFPVPNVKATIERLQGKKIFGTLDLRSGYHQMKLDEKCSEMTAFTTPDGHFEWLRMPFGLKNAPAVFQAEMSKILTGLIGNACELFFDDIAIYGSDEEEFLRNLRSVFERLRRSRLRLRADKCHLGCKHIHYLGHIVDGNGITLSESRKEAIGNLAVPKTTKQVRSLIGLANYVRGFVKDFSTLVRPLTRLCSDKVTFNWTTDCQHAFDLLKSAIRSAPMLNHLDYSKPIYLRTDASDIGLGGVLFQKGEGQEEKVVCFISKVFSEQEQNWSTIEKECYAAYYCILSCSQHLLGQKFILQVDHKNLLYLAKAEAPKLVRWRLRLAEFDFTTEHIPGEENEIPDCLSRLLTMDGDYDIDDILCKVHNDVVGHLGINATLCKLRDQNVSWNTMKDDVVYFISHCPVCQKNRLRAKKVIPELLTTERYEPFETVAVDTIGPLPEDENGNKYIVVFICCFTRFTEAIPTKDCTARSAATAMLQVFGRYGAPKFLRSDQGSQFTSSLITEFLQLLEGRTNRQLTLAYRPQANGIVERVNGEVIRHLKAFVCSRRIRDKWSLALPLALRIINSNFHSSIGTSPMKLLYGNAVSSDRGLLFSPSPDLNGEVEINAYLKQLISVQDELMKESARYQENVVSERKDRSKGKPTDIKVDDYVLAAYPVRPPNKLTPVWRGPFKVLSVMRNVLELLDIRSGLKVKRHVEDLKPYLIDDDLDPTDAAQMDDDEFEVEKIVDHTGTPKARRDMDFQVRWKGYGPDEDTWLPYAEVRELKALDDYIELHTELSQLKRGSVV